MNENTDSVRKVYAQRTYARLLWDEQLKATTAKEAHVKQRLIKWCLNLKLLSSSAYHALRTSGFLTLPTLIDYVISRNVYNFNTINLKTADYLPYNGRQCISRKSKMSIWEFQFKMCHKSSVPKHQLQLEKSVPFSG